jgi:hypothetical protein
MPNTDSSGKGLSPEQMKTTIAALSSPDTVESPFGELVQEEPIE